MKLIFGIGNPGLKYKYTYHNIGNLLCQYYVDINGFISKKETDKYIFYKLKNCNVLQSKVYMNVSFDALRDIYTFNKLNPEDVLVLHDELGLSKFKFKLKFTEGLNGHNGLRDIAKNIGNKFPKLNIGIDHPKNFNSHLDVSDYVLSKIDYESWLLNFLFGVEEINKWIALQNDI